MDLAVINEQGQQVSSVTAADETFGRDYNEALIHQVVTAFQANARSGNRAQQTRAEVTASTHKPWRQKGWPCACRPYLQPDLARGRCRVPE